MVLTDFKDFPHKGRILGIDWGSKRMGFAISSPDLDFVFPRKVEQNINGKEQIKKIIESENIVGIVLGLPLHADGSDSDTTRLVREFAESLEKEISLPIIFIEENLTSLEASERIKSKKQHIDFYSSSISSRPYLLLKKSTSTYAL